jgi:hypothetical protein
MLSAGLKQQIVQLPVSDRLELIQAIVASLQAIETSASDFQKPLSLSSIRAQVGQLGPDPEAPTLEELSQLVREVRQEA